eukprot:991105-Rhodomonas_salina.1
MVEEDLAVKTLRGDSCGSGCCERYDLGSERERRKLLWWGNKPQTSLPLFLRWIGTTWGRRCSFSYANSASYAYENWGRLDLSVVDQGALRVILGAYLAVPKIRPLLSPTVPHKPHRIGSLPVIINGYLGPYAYPGTRYPGPVPGIRYPGTRPAGVTAVGDQVKPAYW